MYELVYSHVPKPRAALDIGDGRGEVDELREVTADPLPALLLPAKLSAPSLHFCSVPLASPAAGERGVV